LNWFLLEPNPTYQELSLGRCLLTGQRPACSGIQLSR
jgi:hypothetical protein